jgi:hypothetical protein
VDIGAADTDNLDANQDLVVLRLRNRDVPKLERERGGVDQCFHDGDLRARAAGHKRSGVPLGRRPGTPRARTGEYTGNRRGDSTGR